MKITKRPDNGRDILAPTSTVDRQAMALLFTELAHHQRGIFRDQLQDVAVTERGHVTGTNSRNETWQGQIAVGTDDAGNVTSVFAEFERDDAK